MNKLLDTCSKYASDWKMEFNAKKSNYSCFGHTNLDNKVFMNNTRKPYTENFIYLGLPIGNDKFKKEYIDNKDY